MTMTQQADAIADVTARVRAGRFTLNSGHQDRDAIAAALTAAVR